MSAFSYHDSVICSGEKEISAALASCAICSARAAAPGCSSASASVKSSQGCLASFAPRKTALFLPTQPAGTTCVSRRRRRGILGIKPRTISAVLSVDWSFTTRISAISGWSASDSIQVAMTASSFRARNEEAVIATCIESLALQPEIAEILVVNDQSTDRTAEIVRGLMPKIPRLRLLETQVVPAGWVGKNNAVFLGAKEAKHPWLLFTDADAELQPGAAARALQIAQEASAALISFSPEQITESWYEKAL